MVEGAVPHKVSLNFSLVVVVVEVGLENCADSLLDEEAGLDGFRIPCLKFLDSLCGHEDVGLGTQLCWGVLSGVASVSRCLNVGWTQ